MSNPDWTAIREELKRVPIVRPRAIDEIMGTLEHAPNDTARARPVRSRLWWAAPLAAAAVFALTLLPERQHPHQVMVQFRLEGVPAQRVGVVGDFNNWEIGATAMRRRGSAWEVELPVRPGHYEYAFVVDGVRWMADPNAPRSPEAREFGAENSVLVVSRRL